MFSHFQLQSIQNTYIKNINDIINFHAILITGDFNQRLMKNLQIVEYILT